MKFTVSFLYGLHLKDSFNTQSTTGIEVRNIFKSRAAERTCKMYYLYTLLVFLIASLCVSKSTVIYSNDVSPLPTYMGIENSPFLDGIRRRCPLCDSSVYSYCSDKLFHDSCCCYRPTNPYDQLPYECQYADCTFLHANTCREHKLISSCCCTNLFIHKK